MNLREKIARALAPTVWALNGTQHDHATARGIRAGTLVKADAVISAIGIGEGGENVLVPREPTEAMLIAGGMIPDAFKGTVAAIGNANRVYRAMLEASHEA